MSEKLLALEKQISKDLFALRKMNAEKSLAEFTKQAWFLIEPETKLEWNWHLDVICAYLEATVPHPDRPVHIKRLIINVPPGSLKSILVSVMFPAWLWIAHPAKRILGIANIQDLAIRDSRKAKIIITSDWYQKRWPLELMADQSAKTNYENSQAGFRGSLGLSGNITGKRGDCFTADTYVETEKGKRLITDIRVGDLVWSYNRQTNEKELQPVEALYSSEASRETIRLHFNSRKDGSGEASFVSCTPEHKFFTEEEGMVAAKDLKSSKPIGPSVALNALDRTAKFFSDTCRGTARVHNGSYFSRSKNSCATVSSWFSKVMRYISPSSSILNFGYVSAADPIFGDQVLGRYSTSKYGNNFFFAKWGNLLNFRTCSPKVKHIIRFSSIGEIAGYIVKIISIQMANFGFGKGLRAYESSSDDLVGVDTASTFSINIRANSQVPVGIGTKLSDFFGAGVKPTISGTSFSSTAFDAPEIANVVHTLKSGDGFPLFVTNITRHINTPVFCLQVKGNHNMYVDKSPGVSYTSFVLVSNCLLLDDPHDAVTVQSDLQRNAVLETYDSKISTRVNSQEHSVIIIIMQRLHALDLTGHLLNKTKTKWVHVVIPMHFDSSYTYNSIKDIHRPDLVDPRINDELMFPKIFSADAVEKLEEDLGEYHCTPGETPITMADFTTKPIKDILVGDKVLGFKSFLPNKGDSYIRSIKKHHKLAMAKRKFLRRVNGRRSPGLPALTPEESEEVLPEWLKGVSPLKYNTSQGRGYISARMFEVSTVTEVFQYENAPVYQYVNKQGDFVRSTKDHRWYVKQFKAQYSERDRGVAKSVVPILISGRSHTNSPAGEFVRARGKAVTTSMNTVAYKFKPNYFTSPARVKSTAYCNELNFVKLTDNIEESDFGDRQFQIKHMTPLGKQKVYALTTTTGNYVAWNHLSSNSAGQLEQRPSPKAGGILRSHWFRVLDSTAELPVCEHIFISCDTAYSEKDMLNNSYSAFTTWGIFWNKAQQRDCILLLDVWFDRVDYPTLRKKAKEMDKEKKPDVWLIEKKASGQSLVQDLRQAGLLVRTYVPTTDKVARAYAIQAMLESGQVWIPDRKWAHHFAYLMGTFPTGPAESSDLADTFTQAALYIRNGFYVSHPDDDVHISNKKAGALESTYAAAYGNHLADMGIDSQGEYNHEDDMYYKQLVSDDSFVD